ncbi:MAG: hypothetical protein SGPRY_014144, partial [Prymnesium sp.]
MLDGCPEVLVNMLLAVRVHLTLIFEAIIECERQQREDTHVNLNLPFTKHACKSIERDMIRQRTLTCERMRSSLNEKPNKTASNSLRSLKSGVQFKSELLPVETMPLKPGPGFERFSKARHQTILRKLPEELTFMPFPFIQDPLLLMWFDDHSCLWRSSLSMNPERLSVCNYNKPELRRLLNAQKAILRARTHHSAPRNATACGAKGELKYPSIVSPSIPYSGAENISNPRVPASGESKKLVHFSQGGRDRLPSVVQPASQQAEARSVAAGTRLMPCVKLSVETEEKIHDETKDMHSSAAAR